MEPEEQESFKMSLMTMAPDTKSVSKAVDWTDDDWTPPWFDEDVAAMESQQVLGWMGKHSTSGA